jgi:hypothetical protein
VTDIDPRPDAWAQVRRRGQQLHRWTDRAVALAAEHERRHPPGRLTQWRGRRTARRAERAAKRPILAATARPAGGRLRFIPPVAALGVAAVLQIVAMTDLAGGPLATTIAANPQLAEYSRIGYLAGFLLGIAVASCIEGGAAYLMDLYDKHLMARDSTWLLRLGMVVYVGASTGLLHWYLAYRNMPTLVSWVLAGMSGLSLFLWSRGSRWANRIQMRDAGQLDPALPKLPAAAKMLHPWRWLVTLYLTSWDPVATTDEARQRYAQWRSERRSRAEAAVEPAEAPPALAGEPESAPKEPADETESGAPGDDETAAQRVRQDSRTAQEIEDAIRAIAAARPDLSRRRIAALAGASPTKVRAVLGPAAATDPAQPDGAASVPETVGARQ